MCFSLINIAVYHSGVAEPAEDDCRIPGVAAAPIEFEMPRTAFGYDSLIKKRGESGQQLELERSMRIDQAETMMHVNFN